MNQDPETQAQVASQDGAPQPNVGYVDPNVIAQYHAQLEAKERQLQLLAEENEVRRLRELRQYEEQERARTQQAEPELPIDPEAKKVLDTLLERTMRPLQQRINGLEAQLTKAQADAEAQNALSTIRQHVPFLDQIGPQLVAELQSLPANEQALLSRAPGTIIKMAHALYNAQGNRSANPRAAAAARAATEGATGGGTNPVRVQSQGDELFWRNRPGGYAGLTGEDKAKADAIIAHMKSRGY